jgi:hypothetical protein
VVLESALSVIFFRKFLEANEEHHNLDFFLEVQELRTLRGLVKVKAKAESIYHQYCRDDPERNLNLKLSEKILEDLTSVFGTNRQIISYASVFNAAADMIHEHILTNLFPDFVNSEAYKEMMREANQDDVTLKTVNSFTMLQTIVSHLKLRPQFQKFLQGQFCDELLLGWIKLEEGIRAVQNCSNVHRQRVKKGLKSEVSLQDLSLNDPVSPPVDSGPVGAQWDDAAVPGAGRSGELGNALGGGACTAGMDVPKLVVVPEVSENIDAKFPYLPSPIVPERAAVKKIMRYFDVYQTTFMDLNSQQAITFDFQKRETFAKWLKGLNFASDLTDESNVAILVELRSEIEVYASNHIVQFVTQFEKQRLESLKGVSSATIRKASMQSSNSGGGAAVVSLGTDLSPSKSHRRKPSSGGIFGTLFKGRSPKPSPRGVDE